MASWFPAQQLQREDRYVHWCQVRGGGQTSRARLVFSIEEALRLVSLPGENEGRVYYFRQVKIGNVSTRAGRQEWIDALQATLDELGSHAIHGDDPQAAAADAVFFRNHQEALEVVLARTLRRELADLWFWPQVIGIAAPANRAEKVLAIIQRLSELPASWLAVAESVTAAIGSDDPVALLALLPPSTVYGWLQELVPGDAGPEHPRPVLLRGTMVGMLLRSMQALGSADPRVIWLASLAVVQAAPSELSTGAAVARARSTLQSLPAERKGPVREPVSLQTRILVDAAPVGEPTQAAGLYFLLNALRHLGIADALAKNSFAYERGLVAQIMQRLAWHAGVAACDPAWHWITSALSEIADANAPVQAGPELFPSNLRPASGKLCDLQYIARAWCVGVRQWCWQVGEITVREVVNRRGVVSLNRTDLDITLPLSSAEVRIRRAGLDIDPGWLPWFGKVVRFQYVGDEAAHAH